MPPPFENFLSDTLNSEQKLSVKKPVDRAGQKPVGQKTGRPGRSETGRPAGQKPVDRPVYQPVNWR